MERACFAGGETGRDRATEGKGGWHSKERRGARGVEANEGAKSSQQEGHWERMRDKRERDRNREKQREREGLKEREIGINGRRARGRGRKWKRSWAEGELGEEDPALQRFTLN